MLFAIHGLSIDLRGFRFVTRKGGFPMLTMEQSRARASGRKCALPATLTFRDMPEA